MYTKNINKWKKAQKWELKTWQRYNECKNFYNITDLNKRASILLKWIEFFLNVRDNMKIFEIGGGGMPVIDYLPITGRFGSDPLVCNYKKLFPNILSKETNYLASVAEELPIRNEVFDAVIMLNVIDHCINPSRVIEQISRILKTNGIIVLSVDVYSKLINILQRLRIHIGIVRRNDILHPHRFTYSQIISLLTSRFKPLSIYGAVLDSLSMNIKKGWPVKKGFITKLRAEQRIYYIGRKL